MTARKFHAVTGAYGYSGKYIARRLLDTGHSVITLTNSVHREHPFGERVPAFPFSFDNPGELAATLESVSVLYNTYWVRFNHQEFSFADAVRNSKSLFEAAKRAGVERVVHFSITKPSLNSSLEYFRGKAEVEKALIETGLSHAILRPAVIFGKEDILLNNIAWVLRRLPVFGIFGNGQYKLQPIYVDDLAGLAVTQSQLRGNVIINAIGPETFTYRQLVRTIGDIIGKKRPIISVSPSTGYAIGRVLSLIVGDVIITREEIEGLMAGLLCVDSPPTGTTRLTSWARDNAARLGRKYTSELVRRTDRLSTYSGN